MSAATLERMPKLLGHDAKWRALQRAFARDQVPQTLLISGPANIGKWTLARQFARLLLCPNVVRDSAQSTLEELPRPCGACRICHQVEIETFPDFRVFRPIISEAKDEKDWIVAPESLEGSIITVEMARKFGDEAMRRPSVGPRKVMIIERAEHMNIAAQNALLKTFEEPIPGLTILFTADNPNGLLPTVRSRCWHLPLGLASDAAIESWLDEQASEDPDATKADAAFIENAVRASGGRAGAAWREWQRLRLEDEESEISLPQSTLGSAGNAAQARFAQASVIAGRIARSQLVGALALTEEAIRLSKLWWEEDQQIESTLIANGVRPDLKKADAKISRSSAARFLDELSNAYRAQWKISLAEAGQNASSATDKMRPRRASVPRIAAGASPTLWSDGLDQIRKTRHYILRNANLNLSLDVLFGRLIAAHAATTKVAPNRRSAPTQNGSGRPF